MSSPNTKKNVSTDPNDLYSTPKIALESFYEQFPEVFDEFDVYYDPANGLGDIADYLKSIGKKVYTSDLVDYGFGDNLKDFLKVGKIHNSIDCIIFNPPFTLTEEFVDKALMLCDNVLMFNRMTTIESNARANKLKCKGWNLETMWQFGFRVSCTKGVNRESTANSVAYSWFHFNNQNYSEKTKLDWITKE